MNIIDILQEKDCAPMVKGSGISSACPFCGGSTRLVAWPQQGRGGRFYCRKCGKTGDAVNLLNELFDMNNSEALEKIDEVPDAEVYESPELKVDRELWSEKASHLFKLAEMCLAQNQKAMNWLMKERGLSTETIELAGFGWIPEGGYMLREDWGITVSQDQGPGEKYLFIPPGLSIPKSYLGKLSGVKIRRFVPDTERRYHLVKGSETKSMVLSGNPEVVFVFESELDAWLVRQEAGDLCTAVAMGSCTCRPDAYLEAMIENAKLVFVAFDSDEYGALNWPWWQKRFKNARRWIVPSGYGKDPGDAFKKGLSIRDWVLAALPPLLQPRKFIKSDTSFTPAEAYEQVIADSCMVEQEESKPLSFNVIDADSKIPMLLEMLAKTDTVYVDTETYSEALPVDKKDIPALDPFRNQVRIISVSDSKGIFLIDLRAISEPSIILDVLQKKTWVGHNLVFDFKSLITDFGERVLPEQCYDTMLAAQLLHFSEDPRHARKGQFSLKGCCERLLWVELDKELQASDWSGELSEEQLRYAAEDVFRLPELLSELQSQLSGTGMAGRIIDLEMAFLLERARIELSENHIDVSALSKVAAQIHPDIEVINAEFNGYGVNPRSQKQLLPFLQEMGFNLSATDKDSLVEYSGHQVIDRLVCLRSLEHTLSFTENALARQVDGVLHPEYRQIGGPTGRMGCYGINLQAIPSPISRMFQHPPGGYSVLTADLPAIEMRIAAIVAEDEVLIDCFKTGRDPHILMASRITGLSEDSFNKASPERKKAKAANFGFLFGMGADTFRVYAKGQGIVFTEEESESFREEFFDMYPGIASWHKATGRLLRESDREIFIQKKNGLVPAINRESLYGRVMTAVGYSSSLNYPVQGSGADMIKESAVKVGQQFRTEGLEAKIIHTVHDDIRVLCPNAEVERVKEILTGNMGDVVDAMLREFNTVPEIKVVCGSPG
jgi:DNA polymerase-1